VGRVSIPIPPLDEQAEIVKQLDAARTVLRSILDLQRTTVNDLDQLDQAILAKAFRGELVPQDPNDEPASVLLERIRAQRTRHTESAKQTSKTLQRSKTGKKWSRLEPQQLMLTEVLTAKGKLIIPEQRMAEASYDDAVTDSQLPPQQLSELVRFPFLPDDIT